MSLARRLLACLGMGLLLAVALAAAGVVLFDIVAQWSVDW